MQDTPPSAAGCRVVELRQYTLHPGRRDDLVTLFDREFVQTQEALGMTILGQFRDLDAPDRFVWLRGFSDMQARRQGLAAFYGGAVWKQHRTVANATMLDSDDVRLLRPAWPGSQLQPLASRPPASATGSAAGLLVAAVFTLRTPASDDASLLARARARTAASSPDGSRPQWVAWYATESAPNDFPALPVRDGCVLAAFALFDGIGRLESADAWARDTAALLQDRAAEEPEVRRLVPTSRSRVRA